MAPIFICRRAFCFNRRLHGVFGISFFAWFMIILLILYMVSNIGSRHNFDRSPRDLVSGGIATQPSWVQYLRHFSQVSGEYSDIKQDARAFLRQSYLSGNSSSEDHRNLESLGTLWNIFRAKGNISADTIQEPDTSPVKARELLTWAQLLHDDITDDAISNINKARKDRPANHKLSVDALSTLQAIVAKMNKSRLPPRSLGERLNIHTIAEPGSEDEDSSANSQGELPAWKRFQNNMRRHRLYSPDDPDLEEVLHNLRTLEITDMETLPDSGTQVKMLFWLSDGSRVLSKPKRLPIEAETREDLYTIDDFERFQGEVAAFHLDRLLGFYRVPPVVARYVNVTSEIEDFAPDDMKETFYPSVIGNQCFYGICEFFCEAPFAVCGNPHLIETSFAFYLPSSLKADRTSWESPWKPSYSHHRKAAWEEDDGYCETVREDGLYTGNNRRMLDVMEMATFDFMQTNLDRHHFHTFEVFDSDANIFLFDNGLAFARSYKDEMGLLAPVTQCCMFRLSTLERLLKLYLDPDRLSDKMRRSLATETVHPLLTEAHLLSLDRRLGLVLEAVYNCVQNSTNYTAVVIDDGY